MMMVGVLIGDGGPVSAGTHEVCLTKISGVQDYAHSRPWMIFFRQRFRRVCTDLNLKSDK
jgi:hypothetical protein